MRAIAWCTVADGPPEPIGHGDLVGRSSAAALLIEDARVSEAHAYVSLREGRLRLLALRGRFKVCNHLAADVELVAGLEIELAAGLTLRVVEVVLPDAVVGVEGDGLPRQALPGTVALDVRPQVRLRPGWQPDAAAVLWSVDDAWRVTLMGQPARPIAPGDQITIDGWTLRVVEIPLFSASEHRTIVDFSAPLRLEAAFHTVRVSAGGGPPAVIGGINGRILSELVALAGPVDWNVVASELWGRDVDVEVLRKRWDTALGRLRARLRTLGLRDDLVHTDGAGHVELLLRPGDEAEFQDG